MKTIRVILIDDEADGIATLKKLLETNCPHVNIIAACSNTEIAKLQIEAMQPDVVFLDIQMPGKTGLDMLAELPERKFETIFVTAHNEYMLQALQFSAADYLLKPVDEDRLTEAVKRVEEKLEQKNESASIEVLLHNLQKSNQQHDMKLCVPTFKGFSVLKLEEIVVCEAEKNYTIFHLKNKKALTVSRTLLEYEKILNNTSFFRIHKTFMVNLEHVQEYQRGEGGIVLMSNGMEVEVSRRKKEEFMNRIKQVFKY
jgi:two-component system, LytTR family, response regulator